MLAASHGFGGGLERVADAVVRCWPGTLARVDLYRRDRVEQAAGNRRAKAGFAARAAGAALRHRPDVVLALHVGLLPVAARVARARGASLALMTNGREVWGDYSRARVRLLHGCDAILAISHFTADRVAERAGLPVPPIVVPLPIEERILTAAAAAQNSPQADAPVFVSVSRVAADSRYKGHWAVADALPGVLERHPATQWVVVGQGDDVPALQRRCRELGVAHAVTFTGRVSDAELAAIYGRALAHVLPSVAAPDARPPTGEGFGLVYGEAAAFGVPSIASTASGGAAELVVHEQTGLAVPPDDTDALSAAMTRLIEDTRFRTRLGEAAKGHVLARYTDAHFAAAMTEALHVHSR